MRVRLDFCQVHIAQENTLSPEPTPLYKLTAVAHHHTRQPGLAPLRRRADAVPTLPVPRPRWRLYRAGGPPQEDLDGGASNADSKGNSRVANARHGGRGAQEGREDDVAEWFGEVPIDSD